MQTHSSLETIGSWRVGRSSSDVSTLFLSGDGMGGAQPVSSQSAKPVSAVAFSVPRNDPRACDFACRALNVFYKARHAVVGSTADIPTLESEKACCCRESCRYSHCRSETQGSTM